MGKYGEFTSSDKVIGVYCINNRVNNKRYVGASISIIDRFSNHMNRDAKKYPHREFYSDVLKYGYECFDFHILEICERHELLEREQYWYDLLMPEYNDLRPSECNFKEKVLRDKILLTTQSEEFRLKKSKQYSTDYYTSLFREVHRNRMRPVKMYNSEMEMTFESLRACADWLNENTNFTGKNKTSKVKAVCDGERNSAYGYNFKYSI
jgi:group I intron endonuclease